MAAPASAISPIASPWRKFRAPAPPIGLSYGAHSNLCVNQIRRNGSAEQKKRYLPKLISGEHVGALAMSEPERRLRRGVDAHPRRQEGRPLHPQRRQDVDHQRPGRRHARGLCQDRPHRRRPRHHRLHRRERRFRVSPPGQKLDKLGMRGSDTSEIVFADCEVPAENVLGAVGNGVNVLMSGLDYERAVLAAGPLGLMQSCLDLVIPYVHQRTQFGQPIGRFQLMQAKLADMYVTLNAAKAYVYAVARACDRGETTREDAAGAILYAAERATWMALETIQCLGGNGYINEFPAGRLAARRQALRDRRRHQRNPPHADRPRDFRKDEVTARHCEARRRSRSQARAEPQRQSQAALRLLRPRALAGEMKRKQSRSRGAFLFAPELCGTPFPKTTPHPDLRQMLRQWKGRMHHDRRRRKTLVGQVAASGVTHHADRWATRLRLNPPYERHERTNEKKTRKQNADRRVSTAAPAGAARALQGALACRRSTVALARGTAGPQGSASGHASGDSPERSIRYGRPNRGAETLRCSTGVTRAVLSPSCEHLTCRSLCRQVDARAARVQKGRTLCPRAPHPLPPAMSPAGVLVRRASGGFLVLVSDFVKICRDKRDDG